jgi:hypothetical protein
LVQLVCPLGDLKQMLIDGWQIDLPVVRKQLPDRPDGDWVVDVILWRDGRVKLLTLRDDSGIDQIVSEQGAE